MANDRFKTLYNDPTDTGSGSSLFVAGEILGPAKLNSWSNEIHLGFLELARVIGDLQNSQVATSNDLIYTTYFTNLARVIGDLDRLSPINPPGHSTPALSYQQILPDSQYEFELDFEISGSYNTSSGTSASLITISTNPGGDNLFSPASFSADRENLLAGEWWTDYEDSGNVRTLKGTKLVTGNVSENSATITFQASTGNGDYAYYDRLSETPTTSKGYFFNVIPTVAQAEATLQSLVGAGGFPVITAASTTATHTISFADLKYTHYKDKDGVIVKHKLADIAHGSPDQNAFLYKIPQYIIDAANRNSGVIPEGMVSLWRYWNSNTGAYILQPAVPDLSKPSRESFVFRVIDDETLEMVPPTTNSTNFTTSAGISCVVAFSAISLAEAVSITRLRVQEHKHDGTDGTALVDHNDLLLPTEGAHKATAISFAIPTTTEAFEESVNIQQALEEVDLALLDHFLKLPALQIPEARRHEDQNIECIPADGLPDGDFDTDAYTQLYGDNLRRNLKLLDSHLDLTDETTNAIMGKWRHAATQIKMTPTSTESVYTHTTTTRTQLENHKFTNATEIVPVHGVRQKPSRYSTTNWNNGSGGTVGNEHGGGDVWGFAECIVGTDIVLDAGIDWRDRLVLGQFGIIRIAETLGGPVYEDIIPGGEQDYQFNGWAGIDSGTAINGNPMLAGGSFFLYTGLGSGSSNYSVSIGTTESVVLEVFATELGSLVASVIQQDGSNEFYILAYKISYGPSTFKRILDPSNPDYVYITTPPPSQVLS